MFKTVLTLFRGNVAAAEEELEDRTALLILDQQMRDAAAAVERSKRTLALAIARDHQEGRRLDTTNARIADLEIRATAALDGGREDLAREAAQSITSLEAVRSLRRGGVEAARPYEATLPEAENTLRRLRERQMEAQAADQALTEIDAANGPIATAERLAEQGFGPWLRPTADDVLARASSQHAGKPPEIACSSTLRPTSKGDYHEPECPTSQRRVGDLRVRFVLRRGLYGRPRRLFSATRSLGEGLSCHGHHHARAILRHPDQDGARHA